MKRDFLSIFELQIDEIYSIFNLARELENKVKVGLFLKPYLGGKTVALLFEKPSTRTRVSFEVAIYQLGGHPLFLSQKDTHLGKSESLEDTARALSRYVNAVIIRTFQQEKLERFARASDVPVINALTDLLHPCQALADYYTLWKRGRLSPQLKFSYIGDGNNVCHSLMLGAAKLGIQLVVATPENYRPKPSIMEKIKGRKNIKVIKDPQEAVKEADVIYTDVWASMGQEETLPLREKFFKDYQVNTRLVSLAKPEVVVMHCLPAHRGQEITDDVIDGERSIVWEQAENRLHVQRALLVKLLTESCSS